MTFKDNINRICKDRGTNLTTLIKECGFSSSKATAINKGQMPTEDQLLIFAKHLGCSVMDFFADEEDLAPECDIIIKDDEERILIEGFRSMPKSKRYALMAHFYALQEGSE